MADDIAIKLEKLTKVYKLYDSSEQRLKESLHPLRKKYHREFYALNDVDLEIRKGESIGVIGKNGSGKSTLLKLITGVLTPTSGAVTVNGKVSALLELGAGFNPELTGIENVYFNGTLMGFTREEIDRKLDDILRFADIGDFVHQPVKQYSSGMMVRLAFGVAINIDPDILIVDEALAVGDIKFQRKCYTKLEEFRERKVTILFVTHGMESVHLLCNRAFLLNEGRILTSGVPKEVTKIYQKMMLGDEFAKDRVSRNLGRDISVDDSPSATDEEHAQRRSDELDAMRALARRALSQAENANPFEIFDYSIVDMEGKTCTVLESGGSYFFVAKLVVISETDNIVVGFRIKNKHGLLIFGVNNRLQHVPIAGRSRGDVVEIRLKTTISLAPGDYFLSLRSGTTTYMVEELSDIIHFKVYGGCDLLGDSIVNLAPEMRITSYPAAEVLT